MSQHLERSIVITGRGLKSLSLHALSKVEGAILWHLVSLLPPAGDIVSKAGLETTLKIKNNNISRSMKRLCEIGFLMRGPKMGLSYHYKLNPAFFRILS